MSKELVDVKVHRMEGGEVTLEYIYEKDGGSTENIYNHFYTLFAAAKHLIVIVGLFVSVYIAPYIFTSTEDYLSILFIQILLTILTYLMYVSMRIFPPRLRP